MDRARLAKPAFLETLLKMMIGQKPKIATQAFTRSSIEKLKRTVQKEIGTAFYREYLRQMLEIMQEYADLPPYIRPLSLEDYFSEKVTGKYAIKTIKAAWANGRKSFTVNTRTNELRYDVVVHYDADIRLAAMAVEALLL